VKVNPHDKEALRIRVVQAALAALQKQGYSSAIDVFEGMGVLRPASIEEWREGRLPYLERAIQMNLKKISLVMKFFRTWAIESGLHPSQTGYLKKSGSDRLPLIFSKSMNSDLEKAYRTHYVSPKLKEEKKAKLRVKPAKNETVVFAIVRDSQCAQCKKELWKGDFLTKRGDCVLCMDCAGLGHLVYLRRGVARLSRLAREYSNQYAVVVQFSRSRKQYERQGILVEEQALEKAKSQHMAISE